MINIDRISMRSLCFNAVDSFLPIFFSGYSVHIVKDDIGQKSFCNNFNNGLKGAFAAQCLANSIPIIAQYTKLLITRVVSLDNESALVQLANIGITYYELLTNNFPSPFIITGCALAFALIVITYKKTLQVALSIFLSGILAKFIVDCLINLNSNLVNLVYLVNFIYIFKLIFLKSKAALLDLSETIYGNYLESKSGDHYLTSKDRAIIAILEARKKDLSFKTSTNALIKIIIRNTIGNKIGIGTYTIQNEAKELSGGVYTTFSKNQQPFDLSTQKIINFMNSKPCEYEFMCFCEQIYKVKLNNKKRRSLIEEFSLVLMKHRSNDKQFKNATDPYFIEIFNQKVYNKISATIDLKKFMQSAPTKAQIMSFCEKVFEIKINEDLTVFQLRKDPFSSVNMPFDKIESLFNDLVCQEIYSFINQERNEFEVVFDISLLI